MVLQAFMDESEGTGPDRYFVLGGLIAPVEAWAAFSQEWENMLKPYGTLAPGSREPIYHFKMAEMAQNDERARRVPFFWEVASRYSLLLVSLTFKVADWEMAKARLHVPGYEVYGEFFDNAYSYAMQEFFSRFHKARFHSQIGPLPRDAVIDFYFDERSEKKAIRAEWDYLMSCVSPDLRSLYGNEPRFERDNDFLPIQAADCFAWFVRYGAEQGRPGRVSQPPGASKGLWSFHAHLSHDVMLNDFAVSLRSKLPPGSEVLDRITGKRLGLKPTELVLYFGRDDS